jgi:hypothetical protein
MQATRLADVPGRRARVGSVEQCCSCQVRYDCGIAGAVTHWDLSPDAFLNLNRKKP